MAGGWWATLEAVSYRGVGLLLTVLWQSSILFAGVGVLSLVLRRSRAAARHALWTIAVFLAPLLPGLTSLVSSVGAPSARIEVLPRPPARQIEASSSRTSPATPTPAASTPLRGEAGSGTHSTSLMCPVGLPWSFAFAGYLVGAALLLSLVELGRLRLAIWVRQAEGTADPRVLNAFRSAQSAVRLRRAIRVAESLRAPTPLTIGSFRPVVLLPQGIAETLSDAELQSVAVHELAHVRRNDAPTLSLVSIARAVLFFQPLIWLAARRISALAEEAADDAVLEVVSEPTAYAQMLVRLAEALPRHAVCAELSAGIVLRKSAFLRRVQSILSDGRSRMRRLSRAALAGVLTSALALVMLAALLPLSAEPAPAAPPIPQLIAHRYYELGKPIRITVRIEASKWKPGLADIDRDWPFVMRIDGRDYRAGSGVGPFSKSGLGSSFALSDSSYRGADLGLGKHRVCYVYRNVEVTSPESGGRPVHHDELRTNEVEFEVVERVPAGYLAEVHDAGWEDALRRDIEFRVTDHWTYSTNPERKHPRMLMVSLGSLPCNVAWAVYAQSEGSDERRQVGTFSALSSPGAHARAYRDERLTWENARAGRWRLHFVPSRDVALANPPIRRFYGRGLTTEWASFEPHRHDLSPFRRWQKAKEKEPEAEAAGDDPRAQLDVRPLVDAIFAAFRAGDKEGLVTLFSGLGDPMYQRRREFLMPSALQVDAIYADRQIAFATSRPIMGTVGRPQVVQIKLCRKNGRWMGRTVEIGEIEYQRTSIAHFLSQHPDAKVLPLEADGIQATVTSQTPKASANEPVAGAGEPEHESSAPCSLRFDGRDDHLRVPHSKILALTPPFTVELWLKPDLPSQGDLPDVRIVLGKTIYLGNGKVSGFRIQIAHLVTRPREFSVSVRIANTESDCGDWPGARWAHLAVRVEGGRAGVLVNGVGSDFAEVSARPADFTCGSPLLIGNDTVTDWSPFKGQIRDLRIWNVARSDKDIRQHMTHRLTGKERGLVAFWPLDEGEGQTARDQSPNHNDAILGARPGPDEADPHWAR